MAEYVFSRRVRFEEIVVHDDEDMFGEGEIYFIARVGDAQPKSSPIFDAASGTTIDLRDKGYHWDFRVDGRTSKAIPIRCECWDEDLIWDDGLGVATAEAAAPFAREQRETLSDTGNFTLRWSVATVVVRTSKTGVAVVSRHYDGSPLTNTLGVPNVAVVRLIDIEGLYKPGVDDRVSKPPGTTRNAGRVRGYLSDNDAGRIFINRTLDGTWTKDTQFIEVTARVIPDTVVLAPGAAIEWTIEDPDDPINENPKIHKDAGRKLDPGDFDLGQRIGSFGDDNDPYGKATNTPRLEQVTPEFALAGNRTLISAVTRESKVRFHTSNVAGDNYVIRAKIVNHPIYDYVEGDATGVMTLWNRIDVEYVKMPSAVELPVEKIADHFDIACSQVDISIKRTAAKKWDLPFMGGTGKTARKITAKFATHAGEFTKEAEPGWFFIGAANRLLPPTKAMLLYEGEAVARGDRIRVAHFPKPDKEVAWLRVFNPKAIQGQSQNWSLSRDTHTKFRALRLHPQTLTVAIEEHDYLLPDNSEVTVRTAGLADYGFPTGSKIMVQLWSKGDDVAVTGGRSPGSATVATPGEAKAVHYFAGKVVVFARSIGPEDHLGNLCHELGHAFGNAHKCGNWSVMTAKPRRSCCMHYWFQFVLDGTDAVPDLKGKRQPLQWTQNRKGADFCAEHLLRLRYSHLQDNPVLGWPKKAEKIRKNAREVESARAKKGREGVS